MIAEEIARKAKKADEILDMYLPKEEGISKNVMRAMNYSIHVGGKRLRPILMMETYGMFSEDIDEGILYPFVAAIEMIHTYSLCHDDLPAMDDDDMRRGMPSTHAKFGEAMGILAGDALLNYAFETAVRAYDSVDPYSADKDASLKKALRIAKALGILSNKAGIHGMIAGQVADIESEAKQISMDTIEFIHENKTAAMIESSMMIGATLAGAADEEVSVVERVGSDIGLAFQIMDDILDVTGTSEDLGKPVGSDEKNNKNTYVSFKGLERSREAVNTVSQRAIEALSRLPGSDNASGTFLRGLIEDLTKRNR